MGANDIQWRAFVSHEISNITHLLVSLLADIERRAGRLSDSRPDPELEALQTQVNQARKTAARLIDITRMGSRAVGEPSIDPGRPVDLVALLGQVIPLVARQLPDGVIHEELEDELPPVRGHEPALFHVFVNLLLNACQALAGVEDPRIELRASVDSDQAVVVTVRDNGCGIAHQDLDRIFEPRYTTDPASGCGLGLAFCREVVSAAGGSVKVDSLVDQGATFTVNLPIWA